LSNTEEEASSAFIQQQRGTSAHHCQPHLWAGISARIGGTPEEDTADEWGGGGGMRSEEGDDEPPTLQTAVGVGCWRTRDSSVSLTLPNHNHNINEFVSDGVKKEKIITPERTAV